MNQEREQIAPQDRLSRHEDIILEAINEYDGWLLDDHFDARSCLDRIIARMRERVQLTALRSGGEGWRLVPVEPRVDMLIAVAPAIQEPSEADYDLARLALANLPFTTHPQALTIVAELARDYRAMLSAAPSPSTHGEG